MKHINHYKYKLALIAIKYIPILMAFIMLCHVITLLLGKHFILADIIARMSFLPFVVIYVFLEALEFCWTHKMITLYTLIVDCCISVQKYIGFGSVLFTLRFLIMLLGIYLFYSLLKHFKTYNINKIKI